MTAAFKKHATTATFKTPFYCSSSRKKELPIPELQVQQKCNVFYILATFMFRRNIGSFKKYPSSLIEERKKNVFETMSTLQAFLFLFFRLLQSKKIKAHLRFGLKSRPRSKLQSHRKHRIFVSQLKDGLSFSNWPLLFETLDLACQRSIRL